MTSAIRWLFPVALAVGLGFGLNSQAQAQNSLAHVIGDAIGVPMGDGHGYRANTGHHDVAHGAYGNGYGGYYDNNRYGNSGYYDNSGYGNSGYYDNSGYGRSGYYDNSGYGRSGYYDNSGYGNNGHHGNGYDGGAPYGNAYGYYGSAPRHHGRGNSRQHGKHDRHDRRDCLNYGQCRH